MALTPEQRGSIVELWHSFHAQLPAIAQARRDIHAAIAATIPSGLEARELAVQYLKVSFPARFHSPPSSPDFNLSAAGHAVF